MMAGKLVISTDALCVEQGPDSDVPTTATDASAGSSVASIDFDSRLRRKIDLRLCSIAGILCSLDLLDSGIISSASVTSMLGDLGLEGNRYSVSIFIFTIASVCFQLPATIAVRVFGPRVFFACITFCFGLITLVSLWCRHATVG